MEVFYECYRCGYEWSEDCSVNVCCCPSCGSESIKCLDFSNKSEIDIDALKKLITVCYNLNFKNFKKILEEAMQVKEVHEDYALEKFEVFKREGVDFLNRLDDATAERFLNELLKRI